MQLYPKLRIALELSNRFVDLVSERFDLAIRYSSAPLRSDDIVARPLVETKMVLVGSPELLASRAHPTDVDQLGEFPTLAQGSLESIRPWFFEGEDGEPLIHHPHPRMAMDNVIALREAAIRGAGLVQLPLIACEAALKSGQLVRVLPNRDSVGAMMYAVYPTRRGVPAAVRVLIGFLEKRYASRS